MNQYISQEYFELRIYLSFDLVDFVMTLKTRTSLTDVVAEFVIVLHFEPQVVLTAVRVTWVNEVG